MRLDYNKSIQKINENNNKITALIQQRQDIWVSDVVFTWRWWLGLAFTIIPWILWCIFRKKESTDRLLYVAFLVIIISVVLDVFGDQYGIWHYRYNVVPILPTYFPWDFTLMPISIIFLLQFKPNWSPWIKAFIFALGSSYIGEPIFHWIGVYQTIHWRFTYSVPIQFCIYLLMHYIYQKNFHFQK
ncbi:hypothetical protein HPT25_22840 [Bacillus sp. BRMEA1]|uniref:CBO0543 family protein n=1 Tax=Neobacillus endophyticus TaxID=2738405 RepID=UPI001566B2D0|nr:CBO0543 family protein [Neobacillus endophyticus]NRD80176.1 hypothetical protein [Neobacillus endophyticus]